jgi:hypothetical protein
MTSPHQVEWPFKDGEGRQTAPHCPLLSKGIFKSLLEQRDSRFHRTFTELRDLPETWPPAKKVPLLIKAVENANVGHCGEIFHRTFKNAAAMPQSHVLFYRLD